MTVAKTRVPDEWSFHRSFCRRRQKMAHWLLFQQRSSVDPQMCVTWEAFSLGWSSTTTKQATFKESLEVGLVCCRCCGLRLEPSQELFPHPVPWNSWKQALLDYQRQVVKGHPRVTATETGSPDTCASSDLEVSVTQEHNRRIAQRPCQPSQVSGKDYSWPSDVCVISPMLKLQVWRMAGMKTFYPRISGSLSLLPCAVPWGQ